MNFLKISLLLLTSLFLFSACGDDEDDNTNTCDSAIASGFIEGVNFNFGSGRAVDTSDDMFDITLYNDVDVFDDACDGGRGESVSVFGTVPAVVGRTDLSFDLLTFSGKTMTMFNSDGFSNIIAIDGYVEVTSVTDTEIQGVLNINDGIVPVVDQVCGTFTLKRCN